MIDQIGKHDINPKKFCCSDVKMQLSINDIKTLRTKPAILDTMPTKQKQAVKKRSIIVKRKRPRYTIDVIKCKLCNNDYDLNEPFHIELNCPFTNERRDFLPPPNKRAFFRTDQNQKSSDAILKYTKYESCNFDVD